MCYWDQRGVKAAERGCDPELFGGIGSRPEEGQIDGWPADTPGHQGKGD